MGARKESEIVKAGEIFECFDSLDEMKRYYDAKEMAIHDEAIRIAGAREEGLAIAKEQGKLEVKYEIAKNLIEMGLTLEQIKKATGLSDEEIRKISNQMYSFRGAIVRAIQMKIYKNG